MRFRILLNESTNTIDDINMITHKDDLINYIRENNIDLSQFIKPSNLPELIKLKGWRLPTLLTLAKPKLTEKFFKALLILSMRNYNVKRNIIPKIIKTTDKEKLPKYLHKYWDRLYKNSLDDLYI